MQKKLIALAVAGLVAAPAFAATSNVDVYGVLTMSVDRINTDDATAGVDDVLTNVSSYASRIGFKGSEDLGGGLKALWQIENQLKNDANTNLGGAVTSSSHTWTGNLRNTFVGLSSSSMGTALIGVHDTPYKLATGKLDPFADTAADYNQIIGNVGGSNNFDLRAGNVVAYITPTFSGLHGAIAYVFGAEVNNGTASDQSAWSVMGMYDNGPIFASLAYETHKDLAADDRTGIKAGFGYNFGNATVGLIYEKAGTLSGAVELDRTAWYLPVTYTMGNIVLKGAYGKAGKIDTMADSGASFWDLGADYNLSKRTKVFALYTKTNNDNNGTYGVAVAGSDSYSTTNGLAAGEDPSVLSLGVRHSF